MRREVSVQIPIASPRLRSVFFPHVPPTPSPRPDLHSGCRAAPVAADPAPDTEAYFTRFVQPMLESTCVHCHNADQQKGDGRLDTLENALKGGENGAMAGARQTGGKQTLHLHPLARR